MALALPIASLTPTPRTVNDTVSMAWCAERLDGMFTAVGPTMAVTVSAERHAEVVEVQGEVHAQFACACSRCAEPVELPVDVTFSHHFVGPGQLDAGDVEPGEEGVMDIDPDVSEHDGRMIELDELCIEHVILALPDVPLCAEDCLGLCPHCGANRNRESCDCADQPDRTSPWAKLAEVRLQKN